MTEPISMQLRRRRIHADNCRLLDCGNCTDPWTCRCWEPDQITDQYVDGYRDAVEHLLSQGLAPAPDLRALRILWRRSGEDRRLAMCVTETWEVAA